MGIKKVWTWVLLLVTGVVIIVLIAVGCAAPAPAPTPSPAPSPAPTPAPAGPIKLGLLMPLTGPIAPIVSGLKAGLQLKLDEINSEVAGRKIEVIIEDDKCDPVAAVDAAKKLVENDKVDAVFGPVHSGAGLAVISYLTPSRTPNIAWDMHSQEVLTKGGGNMFMQKHTARFFLPSGSFCI